MQPIAIGTLVVLNHHEDAGEGNKESIEEVKRNFISMMGNLGILKKIEKKVEENRLKWTYVLN